MQQKNPNQNTVSQQVNKIIHVDMDCFYAAVEMRDFPELQNKPIAVGGKKERRGVISTCNYLAREYGVRSAMSSAYALRLCPSLILVPGRMTVYKQISQQIRKIFLRYTNIIEPLSLDEAYLDVTHCKLYQGSATRIAIAIRNDIFAETGLTASAGIAPIKFLAKIASDLNKPNGQYVITPAEVDEFVKTLPLKKIPGVGKVTQEKLSALGLETCLDIQNTLKSLLVENFGKFGALLYERSHGIDTREIQPNRIRKSVGVETTLTTDIESFAQITQVFNQLFPELISRIERSAGDRRICKQVVKLKFNDFKQTTVEHRANQLSETLFMQLLQLAIQRAEGRNIRLVGISVGLADNRLEKSVSDHNQLALKF